MSNAFKFTVNQSTGIGTILFDYPGERINKLTFEALDEFDKLIDAIHSDSSVKAVTLVSAKKNIFIAGADINEIAEINSSEEGMQKALLGQGIITKISSLPMPTVAVINGACLGGGLELSLAFDYRIATDNPKTAIGLPEVNLGIIPGFGGTQRLPRLIGLQKTLTMILTGKPVDGRKAYRYRLVDALIPQEFLHEKVNEFLSVILQPDGAERIRKQRNKATLQHFVLEKNPVGKVLLFHLSRKNVIAKTKHFYPAPLKAVDVIKKTHAMPLDKGLRIEAEEFSKLVMTDTCRNLISLFFMREKLKKDSGITESVAVKEISNVGVLGAGVMGGAIAWLFTKSCIPTRIKDLNWEAIRKGYETAAKIYKQLKKLRKFDDREINLRMHKLSAAVDYSGFEKLDLVIEAVVEDLNVKQSVFSDLEKRVPSSTIIASNTSTLSITEMGSGLNNPERFIGMHFFNPVNRMPLVEVIPGDKTSPETVAAVMALTKRLGKTPVRVKSCPGFLVNRVLLPYLNEAFYLLQEGVDPIKIDSIIKRFGMPMGPFTLADEVGIDIGYKAAKILEESYGPRMKIADIFIDISKDKSLLGKKSGKGIYRYNGKDKELNPEITSLMSKHSGESQSPGINVSDNEILERLMLIMVNEAARCMQEEIVSCPEYLDMAMIMGTGFPPFRGGLLRYADSFGISKIIGVLKKLESVSRDRFQPCDYLNKMKDEQSNFHTKN